MGLNQTLAESNASMGNLSGLMASLLITIIVSIIIILVVYFSYWVTIKKEEGIYIQPLKLESATKNLMVGHFRHYLFLNCIGFIGSTNSIFLGLSNNQRKIWFFVLPHHLVKIRL